MVYHIIPFEELDNYNEKGYNLKVYFRHYNFYIFWKKSKSVKIYRLDDDKEIDSWIIGSDSLDEFKIFCKHHNKYISNPKHKIHERAKVII